MRFEDLNLHPLILRAVAERGYAETTDVQTRTLQVTLPGRDAAVQSQTGTGKTAAFLITAFERLLRDRKAGRTLIVAPTRELAVQIEGEAQLLGGNLDLTIACIYGGVGYARQLSLLKKGADMVVGTPGRLLDLADRGSLRLDDIGIVVIDEADRLFDMGFMPDLRRIFRKLPPAARRQSLLFSATLNRLARQIAGQYMHDVEFIELTPDQVTVETIDQELYRVQSQGKPGLLLGLLARDKPRNALIFTNTRWGAERLARTLYRSGLSGSVLTGDLPQDARQRVMDDFIAGRFQFLVATDLAARGLDIEGLEMVINYDLPLDIENYVHRIGRTGRAGKSGKAISLACENYRGKLPEIEKYIGMQIPVKQATADLIAAGLSLEYAVARQPRERQPQDDRMRDRSARPGGNGGRDRRVDRSPRSDDRHPRPAEAAPQGGNGNGGGSAAPAKKKRRRGSRHRGRDGAARPANAQAS